MIRAVVNVSRSILACFLWAPAACGPMATSDPAAARSSGSWFTDVTAASGLDFVRAAPLPEGFDLPLIMGGGVAVFDADGDGELDLLFPGAAGARLYLQRRGRFRDATERAGTGGYGACMGAAVGDVDVDGDLDLLLTRLGRARLLLNRGDGTFADATEGSGLAVDGWSTSAAFADLDGDGRLDLFVARYVDYDPDQVCRGWDGGPDWCGPKVFAPLPDVLALGNGDGSFRDVSASSGVAAAPRAGLGVLCEDLDGDGRADVYVANDAYPNQLWVRRADGTWVDRARELGLDLNRAGTAEAGMGLAAADLDGDGAYELLVTNLRDETTTLYRRAQGLFEDATEASGLAGPSLAFTGFGIQALDVELDGDLDLAVANGHVNRGAPNPYSELPAPWNQLAEPDHLFLNDGRGHFTPAPEEGAGFCRTVRISRGLVAADLDRDGDADLVVSGIVEPARILRNDAPRAGHWLSVRAQPESPGARVTVVAGERHWSATLTRSGSYLSSLPAERLFGLGPAERYERIEVRWPDGLAETFPGGEVDRPVVLSRGAGR